MAYAVSWPEGFLSFTMQRRRRQHARDSNSLSRTIKYDQHLKEWASINLWVLEFYYTHVFKIARDWHYRIDGAINRAHREGTLAPPYRRPPDKSHIVRTWHNMVYRAGNVRFSLKRVLKR